MDKFAIKIKMKATYIGAVQRLLWFSSLAREEIYYLRVLDCQNRYTNQKKIAKIDTSIKRHMRFLMYPHEAS
jgi:hypothetical protein